MTGAAALTAYDRVAAMEAHIGGALQIARLLHVIASSRGDMECEALSPLADTLSEHAECLGRSFRELHKLMGGAA